MPTPAEEIALAEECGKYYSDPYGWVLMAFPWGEPGPMADMAGPDDWQRDFLIDLGNEIKKRGFNGVDPVDPILMAVGSGRGAGKSALFAMLVWFVLSTRPGAKFTVSANSFTQLTTRTWAAIKEWGERCITRHWFTVNSDLAYKIGRKDDWFATAQTCKKENSQSFAGQQAAQSTSGYGFDESSTVPDEIFDVAESGLISGEPMMFLFGNVTLRSGKLFRVLFGVEKDKWNGRSIDTRTCKLSNKKTIQEIIATHGIHSDYFRVWVQGLAPLKDDMQFIAQALVKGAQSRDAAALDDDPLIAGLDCSRGGKDATVMRFRRGRDARSIPALELRGEQTADTMQVAAWVIEQLNTVFDGRKIDALFVDAAYGGAIVNRCHQLGYFHVFEVNASSTPPDRHYKNMRAFMWGRMKEALPALAIDGPQQGKHGAQLEVEMTAPGFGYPGEQLLIESKDSLKTRGYSSGNHVDALNLTFASPVAPKRAPVFLSPAGGVDPHRIRAWG